MARKIVTIVFADLIGSTALHERLDPESVSRLMDRYHGTVRAPVAEHGGTVVQLLGDGVMCAFGVPHVAEDDAIRAVRAAVGIQRAFREFAREESAVVGDVGLRVAVNTGEVVVSDKHAAGIGDPLNVAARLQQEAQDGDVLIGESTQRLVSELVTRALYAPGFVLDDRRRLLRLTGDRDMALANVQFIAGSNARRSHTVLATAGDRLALWRVRFAGSDDGSISSAESFDRTPDGRRPGFEIEILQIVEVDAEDRIVAVIAFDPDDRRAAGAEMLERYADAAESLRAVNAHDLLRLRAALSDGFVFSDHRHTGLGRLESADDYVASVAVLFEQAPDVMFEPLYVVATEKHGLLAMHHAFGTLADGGGEFEQVYALIALLQGDRLVGLEFFEPEDLPAARARFEELRGSAP